MKVFDHSILWQVAPVLLAAAFAGAQQAPRLGRSALADVIAAMTLEEKVNLVMGTGMRLEGLPPEMEAPDTGEPTARVPGSAGATFAIPRLGIPSVVMADGPAGLRIQPRRDNDPEASFFCTAFPIATLLSSTWDTDMVRRVGAAVGDEMREYGVDVLLAPALNLQRNPLGGRNFEYYSEDPLISGRMAAAMVKGVQSRGVGTSLKHFAANNHEWNRTTLDVMASERTLREIYLRGFEIAVREASPWTVMTSYNRINGTYASESADLLSAVLRGDWKFDGLVMTDWFGGTDAAGQMRAGNDLLMPGTRSQQKTLMEAVQNRTLDEKILDRNIERILSAVLKSPSFLSPANSNRPDLKGHGQVCREAAASGMVLLKNSGGALPLRSGCRMAVFGNASYDMITGGTGSGDVNEAYSISLIQGLKAAGYEVDEPLVSAYESYLAEQKAKILPPKMAFMPVPPIAERPQSSDEIKRLSAETDAALVTLGRRSGEFVDRTLEGDFYLTREEKATIQAVSEAFHARKKRLVVILNIGGVIETASWRDLADAVLLAWQPGQEAGNAVADVLSGRVNPSGKLATTFPMDYRDVPSAPNFPGTVLLGPDPDNRSFLAGDRAAEVLYGEGIWLGYRHFDSRKIETAYPFGFGLSYTKFKYGKVRLSSSRFADELTAFVEIKNAGKAAGREAVQCYIRAPGKRLAKPAHELRAFAKTRLLEPGESEMLSFVIRPRDLASFDTQRSAWVAEEGVYTLEIGSSSMDIRVTGAFELAEERIVESVRKALSPQRPVRD